MTIFVTGGAGFIASHIVDALVGDGHQVAVIDNFDSGRRENLNPKAELYELDIRDEKVEEVFKSFRPDILIHHAAQLDVRASVADPGNDADVNIIGSLRLFESCVRHKVSKVIFASTGGAIYGEQDYFPADEEHPERPISPYGIAKLAVEKYLYYYKVVYDLPSIALRYTNVYGPRQNPHGEAGVVAIFCEKMLSGKTPVINGPGIQTRDYVFVGDVVRANLLAIKSEFSGPVNIGTSLETDVNTLFSVIRDQVAPNTEAVHGEGKMGEQLRSVVDNKKAQNDPRWKAEISLNEGLAQTVDYFQKQR